MCHYFPVVSVEGQMKDYDLIRCFLSSITRRWYGFFLIFVCIYVCLIEKSITETFVNSYNIYILIRLLLKSIYEDIYAATRKENVLCGS